MTIVGHVDLYAHTQGGRETVRRLWVTNGTINVEVSNIAQDGDPACCGTKSALLSFAWNSAVSRIERTGRIFYSERLAAMQLLSAIASGQQTAAASLAPPDVVETLTGLSQQGQLALGQCTGVNSSEWFSRYLELGERWCEVSVSRPSGYDSAYVLRMHAVDWRSWHATELWGIAG